MTSSPLRPHLDLAPVVVDAFRPVTDEVDEELRVLDGEVPSGLSGTLYRNGAGRLQVHGTPLLHPFDGDGMVARFQIGPSGVRYRNRWVRTREFLEEERAGKALYRSFGTNLPGGWLRNAFRMRFKNAANTSVVHHAGRLLALWEGGLPHLLDARSLHTEGRFDFGGALPAAMPIAAKLMATEPPFSAHPKIDPATIELFNFGLLVGPTPQLMVHTVSADGRYEGARRVPLSRAAFVHDFVLTSRSLVFFATPVRFDVPRALSGLSAPVQAIRRNAREPTEVIIVPRDGGPVRRVRAPDGFFIFHFFNGYEDGDRIVVDGCRMPDFPGGQIDLRDPDVVRTAPFDPAVPTRWTIDATGVHAQSCGDVPMELPTIDPRHVGRVARVGWATALTRRGSGPVYSSLARLRLGSHVEVVRDFAPDLPGEPIFVPRGPRAPEGEGWLLSVVYRARERRSELHVLEATTLASIARFALPHHLPPGFHGCFVASEPSAAPAS